MVDHLIGLILLGLGINTGPFTPNVKGDETVAIQPYPISTLPPQDAGNAGTLTGDDSRYKTIKNIYRLNPLQYYGNAGVQTASGTARGGEGKAQRFDGVAFGRGILQVQEDFADKLETTQSAARKEFEDHQTEFKQQLRLIKDTRKQKIVEKLNTDCQNLNIKRMDKMKSMLEKLSTILTNVSNRTASASAAGKDVTAVNSAIAAAQTAISNSQTLVSTQAGTPCTISITSETNLKYDVEKVIVSLQQNLKATYDSVLTARESVSAAIRALAVVLGEPMQSSSVRVPSIASSSGGTK